MKSPGFSKFRSLIDTWDQYLEEEEIGNQIDLLLNGQPFVMFFKKGKEIYGATEEGRLTFARMKGDDEDEEWKKEANFMGINLTKAIQGHKVHNMFSLNDLKKIKILDKEKVKKTLVDKAKNQKNIKTIEPDKEDDAPPGTITLQGDEE